MLQVTSEFSATSGATVEHVWHATHSPQGPAVTPERQRSDSISLPATAATVVGTVGPLRVLSFLRFHLPTCVTKSFCRYAHAKFSLHWAGGREAYLQKKKRRFLPLMARLSPTMLAKMHSEHCSLCNKRGQYHVYGMRVFYSSLEV